MLTLREYNFCHKIANGVDKELAYKSAFACRKEEMLAGLPIIMARADIHAMLDFITGEMGKYDDEMTKIVRLRQKIYERLTNDDLKPTDFAALTKEHTRLSSELKKLQAHEDEANEDVEALLRDMKGAKAPEKAEVISIEEEVQGDQEGQGREDVLGESVLEEALSE